VRDNDISTRHLGESLPSANQETHPQVFRCHQTQTNSQPDKGLDYQVSGQTNIKTQQPSPTLHNTKSFIHDDVQVIREEPWSPWSQGATDI
jgi:hypothetical protein